MSKEKCDCNLLGGCPKCRLSPPPVVGDLREKIAEWFYLDGVDQKSLLHIPFAKVSKEEPRIERAYYNADSILAIIKEAGYVKLAKDQTLPPKPSAGIYSHDFYFLEGYEAAQKDMAGWRKIEWLFQHII